MSENLSNLRILNRNTTEGLGLQEDRGAFENDLLEATLRYIAISHRKSDDLSKLKGIHTVAWFQENGDIPYRLVDGYDHEIQFVAFETSVAMATPKEEWKSLNTDSYPVDKFLSKIDNSTCYETHVYKHEEKNKILVLHRKTNEKWIQTFCSALFRILPWYYQTKDDVEKDRMFFWSISSLSSRAMQTNENGEKIPVKEIARQQLYKFFTDIMDEVNFDKIVIDKKLKSYSKCSYQRRKSEMESKERDITYTIERLNSDLTARLGQLADIKANLNNLLVNGEGGDDYTLSEFFENHKEISIQNISTTGDGEITYTVKSFIEFYDQDELKRIITTSGSYWNDSTHDRAKKIIEGIFIKQLGTIKASATFVIKGLYSIRACSGSSYESYSNRQVGFPHPHLSPYSCLGANGQYINGFLQSGDWQSAIEQTINATSNINFSDSTVIRYFMENIERHMDKVCITMQNGEEISFNQFLDYLDKNEDEKEKTQNE